MCELSGKNLFDRPEMQLYKRIEHEVKRNCVTRVELNEYTIKALKNQGVYGFLGPNGRTVSFAVNNKLNNFQGELFREEGD